MHSYNEHKQEKDSKKTIWGGFPRFCSSNNMTNKSSPKLFGKSVSLPLTAETGLARFLHVLLAVQYPLQTNSVTQPRVRYIETAMPHVSYTLHCASCPTPPKKKFAPSLTGDIKVHSSHWNNGKMKIVYNSAYVQIEMFNFTFAPQAIIVNGCLCANFQEITMPNV